MVFYLGVPYRCPKFFYSTRKRVKPLAAAACEETDVWVLTGISISFLNFENSTGSGNLGYSSAASLQLNLFNVEVCTAGWIKFFPSLIAETQIMKT